ncbi:MAG TPA: aminopeptidase P N-terminal domain-containing protein, partial [Longimicrobiales bacterium]
MSDRFASRREAIYERLGDGAALVLAASPEITIGRDTELRYHVDAELYYLTGYTEPEAVLVLAPGNKDARFTMFVRPRDQARELWTGARGGEAGALEKFGVQAAYPIAQLEERLPQLLGSAHVIYTRLRAGRPEVDAAVESVLAQARRSRPRTGRGAHTITDAGVLLDRMRLIKDAGEVELMRQAA